MNHTFTSTFFIAAHIIFICIFIYISLKKGWLDLDHRSLFHQKLFWIAILIPFSSFLLYGVWVWKGHTPDLSPEGFETFYNISKVPLLLLAASVPLASIVNNIHRTIQTEKQIKEAEKKNILDSYYTHFKNTLELFKNISSKDLSLSAGGEKFNLYIHNPVSLYNKIYNNSSYKNGANYKASENFKKSITKDWKEISKALDKLFPTMTQNKERISDRDVASIIINLYRLESAFERICESLTLGSLTNEFRPIFRTDKYYYVGLFSTSKSLTNAIQELDNICLKIFDVVLSSEDSTEAIHHSYFLDKKIFLDYQSISGLLNSSHLFAKKVSLHRIRTAS